MLRSSRRGRPTETRGLERDSGGEGARRGRVRLEPEAPAAGGWLLSPSGVWWGWCKPSPGAKVWLRPESPLPRNRPRARHRLWFPRTRGRREWKSNLGGGRGAWKEGIWWECAPRDAGALPRKAAGALGAGPWAWVPKAAQAPRMHLGSNETPPHLHNMVTHGGALGMTNKGALNLRICGLQTLTGRATQDAWSVRGAPKPLSFARLQLGSRAATRKSLRRESPLQPQESPFYFFLAICKNGRCFPGPGKEGKHSSGRRRETCEGGPGLLPETWRARYWSRTVAAPPGAVGSLVPRPNPGDAPRSGPPSQSKKATWELVFQHQHLLPLQPCCGLRSPSSICTKNWSRSIQTANASHPRVWGTLRVAHALWDPLVGLEEPACWWSDTVRVPVIRPDLGTPGMHLFVGGWRETANGQSPHFVCSPFPEREESLSELNGTGNAIWKTVWFIQKTMNLVWLILSEVIWWGLLQKVGTTRRHQQKGATS